MASQGQCADDAIGVPQAPLREGFALLGARRRAHRISNSGSHSGEARALAFHEGFAIGRPDSGGCWDGDSQGGVANGTQVSLRLGAEVCQDHFAQSPQHRGTEDCQERPIGDVREWHRKRALCEGFALHRPHLETHPGERIPAQSRTPLAAKAPQSDVGVDRLGIRRSLAPVMHPYTRGSSAKAIAAMLSTTARDRARRTLREGIYAKTTWKTRYARRATLGKIAYRGGFSLVPVTSRMLELVASALKAGGYRSGAAYLGQLRQMHETAGYTWSPDLGIQLRGYIRSLERGMGPSRSAPTVRLEDIASLKKVGDPVVENGPVQPVDFVLVASAWMMRGAEAAAVLGEQVTVSADGDMATIELGPTKTNPQGRECPRTLRCCCRAMSHMSADGDAVCPVHALCRVLDERRRRGIGPKGQLFPLAGGQAPPRRAVIATLRKLARHGHLTEHSMRRMGAQYYARRGVPTAVIEFLGRWGGPTVIKYIGEAQHDTASNASIVAASGSGAPQPSFNDLKAWVLREIRKSTGGMRVSSPGESGKEVVTEAILSWEKAVGDAAAVAHESWAKMWEDRQQARVGGVHRRDGLVVHEVLLGDAALPVDLWVTRCGWRFGSSPHVRGDVDRRSCMSCMKRGDRALGSRGQQVG